MIKEQDLLDAISECQGERNPNANTCIKLAAYYTILKHMTPEKEEVPTYSYAEPVDTIHYNRGSEFADVINGMYIEDALDVIDELMDTLQVLTPKLYEATIKRLKGL